MSFIQKFMRLEAAGGFLLVGALVLALIAKNSSLNPYYDMLLATPVELRVGSFYLAKPLLLWVNDALMAVFFFLVGLELKREVLKGQLSSVSNIVLPALAAVAGIAVPALIYTAINYGDPEAMKGWAIPAATDIAFALGVISLLGKRVPAALKLFLLAVAIIDDIGAIVIIAIFYSGDLSVWMFALAGLAMVILLVLNWRGVTLATPYILVGIVLWVAILKSGIHATLAGILLAMFIPIRQGADGEKPLLLRLEHDLHGTVAFVILPVFAFANAGISLAGLSFSDLLSPVPLGIALGLAFGKQLGIFAMVWVAVKSGIARLPENVSWLQMYGLSVLCGIGFTMSLFISSLAFEQGGATAVVMNDRLGIIVGSLVSAVVGYAILRLSLRPRVE
ncbi:MAG TPA: Na+/H+ antiporter NhaA [Devosia sp.]|nr:Na+/H+ antiporter NhaA [Devosia sp.]